MGSSPLHQRLCLKFRATSIVLLLASVLSASADDPPEPTNKPVKPAAIKHVIGSKFQDALDQPLGIAWTDESLRAGLLKLADARQISILLDRRVDPDTPVSLNIQRAPLRDLLTELADQQHLGMSIVGNVVYLGPPSTTARLRTVIEQQAAKLAGDITSTNKPPVTLVQRRSLAWQDYDRPSELVTKIAEQFAFKVDGLEAIPHDLWPVGNIPNSTPTEMLLLVLAQFDLSIEWQPKGASVRIVPLPDAPTIERTYDAKTKAADVAKEWLAEFPEITTTVKGTKVTARATVEQHEQLEASLRPNRPQPGKLNGTGGGPKTVSFSFEIKNAPLKDILEAVQKQSSFVFVYDAAALKQGGADWDRRLNLKMTKASANELFHAMFDDVGIAFELDGNKVNLSASVKK